MNIRRNVTATMVIIEKNVRVFQSNDNDSFFLPSIYISMGFPKTKNPVMEADITKSKSRVIGTKNVFDLPILVKVP